MVDWCKQNKWALDVRHTAGYTGGTPGIEKLNASVAAGTPANLVMNTLGITQLRQAYALDAVSGVVEAVKTCLERCVAVFEVFGLPDSR